MSADRRRRAELPEILAAILESRGAAVARNGMIWEASLPPELAAGLGAERIRLVAAPAGRAARGAEMDAAMTERILLLGRGTGQVVRLVAPAPAGRAAPPRSWVRLHWRIRYGSDEIPEELLTQTLALGPAGEPPLPSESSFREPTREEERELPSPDPEQLAVTWARALRQLEGRIRRRLRPHADRARRELHREMRALSAHYRSLIAEERMGRSRRPENREADRMLQLKEDWERKLAAVVHRRALDTEASLVAAALLVALPRARGTRGRDEPTDRGLV